VTDRNTDKTKSGPNGMESLKEAILTETKKHTKPANSSQQKLNDLVT
jgi:hypothetical protein